MTKKKDVVSLKSKGDKSRKQEFELNQALKLLKLKNSQWELADDKYTFDGLNFDLVKK